MLKSRYYEDIEEQNSRFQFDVLVLYHFAMFGETISCEAYSIIFFPVLDFI